MSFLSESLRNLSKVSKVDDIAKNDLLIKELLIREIIKNKKIKWGSATIQKRIAKAINHVCCKYNCCEQETVYIFLNLWYCGYVSNFNFFKAYKECSKLRLELWKYRYDVLIKKYQQELCIV
ncbi:MAG: hypothetical protein IJ272_09445 [Clostridia bacterium]|nr:hypothetical protein [Clostridia bacterium]